MVDNKDVKIFDIFTDAIDKLEQAILLLQQDGQKYKLDYYVVGDLQKVIKKIMDIRHDVN